MTIKTVLSYKGHNSQRQHIGTSLLECLYTNNFFISHWYLSTQSTCSSPLIFSMQQCA